uniref:Calponin-homology (CH) domain-containing protein n=1 Tax=Strigamia maritima TaxID=126957 RepID=T1JG64_STRMM
MADNISSCQSKLEGLNSWLDQFHLSRPKRNIGKDFADGVLISEILQYHFPKLVEIHNYIPANGIAQKKSNWETLNRKVLSKLNAQLNKTDLDQILTGKCGVIENFLLKIKHLIENYEREKFTKPMGDSAEIQTAESLDSFSLETDLPTFVPSVLLADKDKEIMFQRETIKVWTHPIYL